MEATVTDCEICKPDPVPEHKGPGVPVPTPGTRHRIDCPTFGGAFEVSQDHIDFAERCRRARVRAMEQANNWLIG